MPDDVCMGGRGCLIDFEDDSVLGKLTLSSRNFLKWNDCVTIVLLCYPPLSWLFQRSVFFRVFARDRGAHCVESRKPMNKACSKLLFFINILHSP